MQLVEGKIQKKYHYCSAEVVCYKQKSCLKSFIDYYHRTAFFKIMYIK